MNHIESRTHVAQESKQKNVRIAMNSVSPGKNIARSIALNYPNFHCELNFRCPFWKSIPTNSEENALLGLFSELFARKFVLQYFAGKKFKNKAPLFVPLNNQG